MSWKVAGINFDHFHMGDMLRMVHDHPDAEIVGISDEQSERMLEAQKNFVLREGQVKCPRYRGYEPLPSRCLPFYPSTK